MQRARFAIAVLLGLIFSVPGYARGPGQTYTLTPYDVPHNVGSSTSLFDLAKGGQFVVGTYFTNRQNAFNTNQKRGTLTLNNVGGNFVNFAVAISNVALVGSTDRLDDDKRVGTIWPRKPSFALWKKTLGPSVRFPSSTQEPIVIDIENYNGTALLGLNNRGQVVGAVQRSDLTFRGFSIAKGTVVFFDYPGAQSTFAEGIRNNGTIVGYYTLNNVNHGFLLHPNGQIKSFDVPQACETFIFDTNDAGDLAGAYVDCASRQRRGYVRTRKDQLIVVTFPGAGTTATEVQGLDEHGNIAGHFDVKINATEQRRHGFLGVLE